MIFKGQGTVSINSSESVDVAYEIKTFIKSGARDAIGLIEARAADMMKIFDSDSAYLKLETGERVHIIITQYSLGGPAAIRINGDLAI